MFRKTKLLCFNCSTHDVILGGTHQHDENLSVNLVDKKRILGGCSQMAPGLLVSIHLLIIFDIIANFYLSSTFRKYKSIID